MSKDDIKTELKRLNTTTSADSSAVIVDDLSDGGMTLKVEKTKPECILMTVYLPATIVENNMRRNPLPNDKPLPLTSVGPAWAEFAYSLIDLLESVFNCTISDGLYAHELATRDNTQTFPFQKIVNTAPPSTAEGQKEADEQTAITMHYPPSRD
ncbi:hypothetical protein [Salinibaculum rarum]|uniref:hypothetical protein n=1 Tax=Salinibaculum rarum TaxID=3058903 RepID=UPI00265F49BB|nr:hypothetical protein [Salinibaculum sp. KK48]